MTVEGRVGCQTGGRIQETQRNTMLYGGWSNFQGLLKRLTVTHVHIQRRVYIRKLFFIEIKLKLLGQPKSSLSLKPLLSMECVRKLIHGIHRPIRR